MSEYIACRHELPPLVVILGYTATGKTGLSTAVAQAIDGEIVSADSRQVYKHLDLGTAKVSEKEQRLIPHHLIDVAEPGTTFSVGEYQTLSFSAIDGIIERGRIPILVGGTGLYIWSVVDNLRIPRCPPNQELRSMLEQFDVETLVSLLGVLDTESAQLPHVVKNKRRLVRALEVSLITGRPFSEQKGLGPARYNSLQIGLEMPSDMLHQAIDSRVDLRLEQGMVNEVRMLLEMGVPSAWLDSLGLEYRHVLRYINGERDYETMVGELKTNIHQFAKRQKTWFKRDDRIVWFEAPPQIDQVVEIVENFLEHKK